jgi:hypothetical protein
MGHRITGVCAIAIVWVAASCGSSTEPNSVVGVYSLRTIDGLDLAVSLQISTSCEVLLTPVVCAETSRLEVRSGTLSLGADSSYRIQTSIRRFQPSGAQSDVTSDLRGDWSLQGGQVVLVDSAGTHRSGTTGSGSVTVDVVPGQAWAYRK